jgi:hypothetical protein
VNFFIPTVLAAERSVIEGMAKAESGLYVISARQEGKL